MYIPLVRERVRVNGRRGEFLVQWADYSRQIADLVSTSDNREKVSRAPFESLFATWEEPTTQNQIPMQKTG